MHRSTSKTLNQASRVALIALIKSYQQVISPWLGDCCRFYPSCSNYTRDAIRHRGVIMGCLLGGWRILRCNPFSSGGFDPVPKNHKEK